MITREQIEQAKQRGDTAFFRQMLDARHGTRHLLTVLERLGRLPPDFDPEPLLNLLSHPSAEVRLAAVKGLARLENPALLTTFTEPRACRKQHAGPQGAGFCHRASAHAGCNPYSHRMSE